MNETQNTASSAVETPDAFKGENVSLHEYNQYRDSGEVPERFRSADAADSATAKDSSEGVPPESDPDSETGQQQEKKDKPKNQTAAERIAKLNETLEKLWSEDDPDTVKIAQITATIEKIERGAGLKRKTEVATVTEPPNHQQAPQPQYTRPKPTSEDKDDKGNPKYETYEDFIEDLADWKAEQRLAASERERQQQSQIQELNKKVADARERYGDTFDDVLQPTVNAILSDPGINPSVKAMMNDSEVIADLMFTIGSDEKTLRDFLAMAKNEPGKALRYIATLENGIIEELGKSTTGEGTSRDESGKFVSKEPPAKQKTSATKPPETVRGASSSAFDVSDESLSPEEWAKKRTADLARRKA